MTEELNFSSLCQWCSRLSGCADGKNPFIIKHSSSAATWCPTQLVFYPRCCWILDLDFVHATLKMRPPKKNIFLEAPTTIKRWQVRRPNAHVLSMLLPICRCEVMSQSIMPVNKGHSWTISSYIHCKLITWYKDNIGAARWWSQAARLRKYTVPTLIIGNMVPKISIGNVNSLKCS